MCVLIARFRAGSANFEQMLSERTECFTLFLVVAVVVVWNAHGEIRVVEDFIAKVRRYSDTEEPSGDGSSYIVEGEWLAKSSVHVDKLFSRVRYRQTGRFPGEDNAVSDAIAISPLENFKGRVREGYSVLLSVLAS